MQVVLFHQRISGLDYALTSLGAYPRLNFRGCFVRRVLTVRPVEKFVYFRRVPQKLPRLLSVAIRPLAGPDVPTFLDDQGLASAPPQHLDAGGQFYMKTSDKPVSSPPR